MSKLILKIIVFSIVSVLFKYLVAWPLTPFIVLCVNSKGELPRWLYWFTTPDNPKLEDAGWIKDSRPFRGQRNAFERYVNRCFWLWRNSGYGFSEQLLSVRFAPGDEFIIDGDPNVSNQSGVQGLVMRYLKRDGKLIALQFYYIKQHRFLKSKCIRINIGWKLWNYPDGGTYASFVFSPWILNSFKEIKQ